LEQRLDRMEPGIRERLDGAADVAATITDIIERHQIDPADFDHPDADVEGTEVYNRIVACTLDAIAAITEAAPKIGPSGMMVANTMRHLIAHVFGDPDLPPGERLHPIRLLANVGQEVRSVEYGPGDIAMIFGAAREADREAYGGLIDAMQTYMGHPTNKGGRPRREVDPTLSRIALFAAKMHHWRGWPLAIVDQLLDLPRRGVGDNTESAEQRARRYVETGEKQLQNQYGLRWQEPTEEFEALWARGEGNR